jgi:hypothetical protein
MRLDVGSIFVLGCMAAAFVGVGYMAVTMPQCPPNASAFINRYPFHGPLWFCVTVVPPVKT